MEARGFATGAYSKALCFDRKPGYYNDIAEMAAALFESLLLNHAFVDGNKRVAFFVTDVFLRLNGWKLSVESDAAYDFIIGMLERGDSSYGKLLPWIKQSLTQIKK